MIQVSIPDYLSQWSHSPGETKVAICLKVPLHNDDQKFRYTRYGIAIYATDHKDTQEFKLRKLTHRYETRPQGAEAIPIAQWVEELSAQNDASRAGVTNGVNP